MEKFKIEHSKKDKILLMIGIIGCLLTIFICCKFISAFSIASIVVLTPVLLVFTYDLICYFVNTIVYENDSLTINRLFKKPTVFTFDDIKNFELKKEKYSEFIYIYLTDGKILVAGMKMVNSEKLLERLRERIKETV